VKRACATILFLVYLYSTVGATIYQHYCMGQLVSYSVFGLIDKDCGKCGMKNHTDASKDCCKDIPIILKSDDFHTSSQIVYTFHALTFILPSVDFISISLISEVQKENIRDVFNPPKIAGPLFIYFCNIRILEYLGAAVVLAIALCVY
jgi:hypothetical protein